MYKGSMTKIAVAAHLLQYLLVDFGDDADHVAIADGSTAPIGVCPDTPDANEHTAVQLLGCAHETRTMVAAAAIGLGERVFASAAGKIVDLPEADGTYYCVGRSLEVATADGDEIEVDPCQPYPVVVAA